MATYQTTHVLEAWAGKNARQKIDIAQLFGLGAGECCQCPDRLESACFEQCLLSKRTLFKPQTGRTVQQPSQHFLALTRKGAYTKRMFDRQQFLHTFPCLENSDVQRAGNMHLLARP